MASGYITTALSLVTEVGGEGFFLDPAFAGFTPCHAPAVYQGQFHAGFDFRAADLFEQVTDYLRGPHLFIWIGDGGQHLPDRLLAYD